MNTLAELTPDVLRIVEQYNKHRERCVKWKKEHPEKNCVYVNKYYNQMKENPEKYKEYLAKQSEYYKSVKDSPENVAKRKEYYQNVIKPKKALLKQGLVPQTI